MSPVAIRNFNLLCDHPIGPSGKGISLYAIASLESHNILLSRGSVRKQRLFVDVSLTQSRAEAARLKYDPNSIVGQVNAVRVLPSLPRLLVRDQSAAAGNISLYLGQECALILLPLFFSVSMDLTPLL